MTGDTDRTPGPRTIQSGKSPSDVLTLPKVTLRPTTNGAFHWIPKNSGLKAGGHGSAPPLTAVKVLYAVAFQASGWAVPAAHNFTRSAPLLNWMRTLVG